MIGIGYVLEAAGCVVAMTIFEETAFLCNLGGLCTQQLVKMLMHQEISM